MQYFIQVTFPQKYPKTNSLEPNEKLYTFRKYPTLIIWCYNSENPWKIITVLNQKEDMFNGALQFRVRFRNELCMSEDVEQENLWRDRNNFLKKGTYLY